MKIAKVSIHRGQSGEAFIKGGESDRERICAALWGPGAAQCADIKITIASVGCL